MNAILPIHSAYFRWHLDICFTLTMENFEHKRSKASKYIVVNSIIKINGSFYITVFIYFGQLLVLIHHSRLIIFPH